MEESIYEGNEEKLSIAQPIIRANCAVLHAVLSHNRCDSRIQTTCSICSISRSTSCDSRERPWKERRTRSVSNAVTTSTT